MVRIGIPLFPPTRADISNTGAVNMEDQDDADQEQRLINEGMCDPDPDCENGTCY